MLLDMLLGHRPINDLFALPAQPCAWAVLFSTCKPATCAGAGCDAAVRSAAGAALQSATARRGRGLRAGRDWAVVSHWRAGQASYHCAVGHKPAEWCTCCQSVQGRQQRHRAWFCPIATAMPGAAAFLLTCLQVVADYRKAKALLADQAPPPTSIVAAALTGQQMQSQPDGGMWAKLMDEIDKVGHILRPGTL